MTDHYQMKAPLKTESEVDEWGKTLFERSKKAYKMVPNLYQAMANAPEILQSYMDCYQNFREHSGFTSAEQEVILLVISYENGCEYCMAAHSTMADFYSKVPTEVTEAIRTDNIIPDGKLRALAEMTKEMLLSRGRPSPSCVEQFLRAGYQEKQLLDIVLAIATKTMSNYTNHLFSTPVDAAFKAREFKAVQFAARVVNYFRK
ncbi:TPA: carboxymuconolactone decarboxylase family protein [Legionella pneumophila]|uniref:carboxymuconolactone decarboxylase family protein n=1 Tax=Legionella pneumophila TaxID=446 RepID=UPI000D069B22|nr:carboxymuconolactone decarboxylase family protein [Legionella pneumophila]MCH9115369.1 carboxymuconolactone decarboxylase family protein [Legionella pneumophila serogroup 1]HAT1821713.1 carboxymuconolactone decarboxylase family protein [Legionella pneumophila]HAU1134334.1 carboxymuconolactone decarboxylase family protein [Legionella pneumophila]HAU1180782.1 carboxymuconolactone decarboxylase family protein [Legionella pneumophila]HAU1598940.1 carboxymuconolactone decarboxylase family protei